LINFCFHFFILFYFILFFSKIGMGDIPGVMKLLEEAMPAKGQPELAKRLQEGKFSLRDMYDQFQNIMKMGPLDKGIIFENLSSFSFFFINLLTLVMQMLPGFNNMPLLQGGDGTAKLKAYITIMDSMTDEGTPSVLLPSSFLT
jgi:signal recognition particle subunit SRP54